MAQFKKGDKVRVQGKSGRFPFVVATVGELVQVKTQFGRVVGFYAPSQVFHVGK